MLGGNAKPLFVSGWVSSITKRTVLLLLVAFSLTSKPSAYGHGFGQRPDLPIPESFYWIGAASAVVLSFVIVSIFVGRRHADHSYGTRDLLQHGGFGRLAQTKLFFRVIKGASIFVLLLTISAGLLGSHIEIWNWAPTFIWIVWWVGFGFATIIIGNFWRVVNPWKAIYEGVSSLTLRAGRPALPRFTYPRRLGVWPAFSLFLLFIWLELVFPEAGSPRVLAVWALGYSAAAVIGMFLFGKNIWLHYGEPFSVFFRYLSMLSFSEVRVKDRSVCKDCSLECAAQPDDCINCYECYERSDDRQVNLRPFAMGLLNREAMGLDRVMFILLMLSSVTFDGLTRTYFWFDTFGLPKPFDPSLFQLSKVLTIGFNTAGLVSFVLFFTAIYLAFVYLVKRLGRTELSLKQIAMLFIVSLLPIAMVYQVAHYSLFYAFNGSQIIRLISDPFGFQWNLLGTRFFPVGFSIDFVLTWNYQVAVIVIGHVIGVFISHRIAIRAFGNPGSATRSQFPMLGLMVVYTVAGLWLLSTPSV